ncbi:MAG: hypothetical protein RSE23_01905 [Clostridia bacterium]
MTKEDWIRKLTSRKLWVAISSFVSLMVVALGVAEDTASQITAIIMAGASMVAYIIGEGLVDSSAANAAYNTDTATDVVSSNQEKPPYDANL